MPVRPMPPWSRGMKEHLQPTHNTQVSRNLDRNMRTGLAVDPAALAARSGHQQWARHVPLDGLEAQKRACLLKRDMRAERMCVTRAVSCLLMWGHVCPGSCRVLASWPPPNREGAKAVRGVNLYVYA